MSVKDAGDRFSSTNSEILKIDSPRNSIEVFKVIFIEQDERWAVVVANWDDEPRLCMRWFCGEVQDFLNRTVGLLGW